MDFRTDENRGVGPAELVAIKENWRRRSYEGDLSKTDELGQVIRTTHALVNPKRPSCMFLLDLVRPMSAPAAVNRAVAGGNRIAARAAANTMKATLGLSGGPLGPKS